jgi:hypothetical protein
MRLLEEASGLLRSAGYRTRQRFSPEAVVHFEDEVVMGFLAFFDDASSLLDGWKAMQDGFLRGNAARLKQDPSKAWNVYAILLTPEDPASEADFRELRALEEDFRSTRKIARAGVTTRDKCRTALAPLLPLVHLSREGREAVEALPARLTDQEKVLLRSSTARPLNTDEIIEWLMTSE